MISGGCLMHGIVSPVYRPPLPRLTFVEPLTEGLRQAKTHPPTYKIKADTDFGEEKPVICPIGL
jgi:hypothetical protein